LRRINPVLLQPTNKFIHISETAILEKQKTLIKPKRKVDMIKGVIVRIFWSEVCCKDKIKNPK
jgi:hypothetical protein